MIKQFNELFVCVYSEDYKWVANFSHSKWHICMQHWSKKSNRVLVVLQNTTAFSGRLPELCGLNNYWLGNVVICSLWIHYKAITKLLYLVVSSKIFTICFSVISSSHKQHDTSKHQCKWFTQNCSCQTASLSVLWPLTCIQHITCLLRQRNRLTHRVRTCCTTHYHRSIQ